MSLLPSGSWLSGQNGLNFNSTYQAEWSDNHPFNFTNGNNFGVSLGLGFKLTADIPTPAFGHLLQLDHETNSQQTGSLSQVLLFVSKVESISNDCITCIPQTVTPISCTDKYLDYKTYFNFIPSLPTIENGNTTTPISTVISGLELDYTEAEFCSLKLGYLVDSYKAYLAALNVNSVNDSKYLSIVSFGNTNLHYGYNAIATVITAYATYCSNSTDADELSWNEWVNTDYLVKNKVCPPAAMAVETPFVALPTESVCDKIIKNLTALYQQEAYNAYIASLRDDFIRKYIEAGMQNVVEKFTMTYDDQEYQYTLYYYDQAGNLTQTVAPEGVNRLDSSLNNQINAYRAISNPLSNPTDDSKTR